MEDAATGEIRLSILWEWVHKGAKLTEDDPETGAKSGDRFDVAMFQRLLAEEYDKLLHATDRDVHAVSKIDDVADCARDRRSLRLDETKVPWYIDLLNINLNNTSLPEARERIRRYMNVLQARWQLGSRKTWTRPNPSRTEKWTPSTEKLPRRSVGWRARDSPA